MDANVPTKLMYGIYEKLWAMNLTLNLAMDPLRLYFIIKTHFDLIVFYPKGSSLYS